MDGAEERIKLNVVKGILILSIIASGQFKSCSTEKLTAKVLSGNLKIESKEAEKILVLSKGLFERR